jgi:hypothetical protein
MELLLFPAAATLLLLGAELLDTAFALSRHPVLIEYDPSQHGETRLRSATSPSPELHTSYDQAA